MKFERTIIIVEKNNFKHCKPFNHYFIPFNFKTQNFQLNTEILLLTAVNATLKERHEIEANYNHLHIKFNQMQKDESERKDKVS